MRPLSFGFQCVSGLKSSPLCLFRSSTPPAMVDVPWAISMRPYVALRLFNLTFVCRVSVVLMCPCLISASFVMSCSYPLLLFIPRLPDFAGLSTFAFSSLFDFPNNPDFDGFFFFCGQACLPLSPNQHINFVGIT